MAMAMARARMAMAMAMAMAKAKAKANWSNGFRQMSVRSFKSDNRSFSSVGAQSSESSSIGPYLFLGLGYICLSTWDDWKDIRMLRKESKESKARLRKTLGEMGITRESCEAHIAKIKQKIASGTDSQSDSATHDVFFQDNRGTGIWRLSLKISNPRTLPNWKL